MNIKTPKLTKEEAILFLMNELKKGRESGIKKGYHSIEEVRALINNKNI